MANNPQQMAATVKTSEMPRLAPLLVMRAWFELLRADFIAVRGFEAVFKAIHFVPTRTRRNGGPDSEEIARVVHAVRAACMFYIHPAKCLQRSAAVTRMLRRRGFPANLVIGYQPMPFRSHAWVELNREVVSDRVAGLEHFHIVDRW